jgi:ribosomal protein S27AE
MAEYIPKDKAVEACFYGWNNNAHDCAENIRAIHAADVRSVVKSHWVDNRVAFYRGCPECGAFVRANLDEVFLRDFPSAVGKLNFCPNCGANMKEE